MGLTVIGLGLGDEKDITVRGLEAVRQADFVYLEAYTSILTVGAERLSEYYGKDVIVADRELVEQGVDEMLERAKDNKVCFLVVGDPFGATTHTDLLLRARELHLDTHVVHNASIMNAVSACGLQLYKFGQAVSIVFFTETWRPSSFYAKLKVNHDAGLHSLCLLDIKVKEQSEENILRGRKIFEPPRYMSAALAAQQLMEVEESEQAGVCTPDTLAVALARVGCADQRIVAGTLKQLSSYDMGSPLHTLVLVGAMDEVEKEFLQGFLLPKTSAEHATS